MPTLDQSSIPNQVNEEKAITQENTVSGNIQSPNLGDVNHVIEGTGKPVKKGSKWVVKLTLILIIITVILGLGGGFIILQNYRNNPLRLISKSFSNLESTSSYSLHAALAKNEEFGLVDLTIDYHKAPFLFSRGQAKITSIGSELGHNLLILAIFNAEGSFLQASYSKIDSFENQLNLLYPQITALETYQLILPVVKGQKWLHLTTREDSKAQGGVEISEEKATVLNKKFIETIVVRSHNANYKLEDSKYHRIVLGFDEPKLIEFIEEVKSLDLEIQLKQINSLSKIVQSVENWNDDLVEILIEKDTGNLFAIALSLPKIPEDALDQTIVENVEGQSLFSPLTDYIIPKLKDVITPPSHNNLTYIGKVEFINYNQAPSAQKPSPTLEQIELEKAFEKDLPAILQAIFLQLSEESQSEPDYLQSI